MSETNAVRPALLKWVRVSLEALWLLSVVLVPIAFFSRGELVSASAIAYVEVPKVALLRTLAGLIAALWLIELGLQSRGLPLIGAWPSATRITRGIFSPLSLGVGFQVWFNGMIARSSRQPQMWIFLAVGLFLLATVLSTLLSVSFSVSMWGEVPGEDGYSAYTAFAYILLFAVIATHLKSRQQLGRLLGAIAVMGGVVATFAIIQNYGYDPFGLREPPSTDRSTATMGSAILAGAVLMMTIPMTVTAAAVVLRQPLRDRSAWPAMAIWTGILTLQILALIFVQSRGPWVGAVAALISLALLALIFLGWRESIKAAIPLGVAILLAWAIVFLPGQFDSGGADPGATSAESSSADTVVDDPVDMTGVTPPTALVAVNRLVSLKADNLGGGLSGRIDIWENSWRLFSDRPWYDGQEPSRSSLRSVFGYGPDTFRYVYFLESPPLGPDLIPREPVHAHNFFLHYGVESGYLGMIAAIGIFVVPLGFGLYLLIWRREYFPTAARLAIAGSVAVIAGRSIETSVGLARVSDLTVFWVLLGLLAALPLLARSPASALSDTDPNLPTASVSTSQTHNLSVLRHWHWIALAVIVVAIGFFTWAKAVNNFSAAIFAANGVKEAQKGDFQAAEASYDRAIGLAPDIWINHNRRAALFIMLQDPNFSWIDHGCEATQDPQTGNVCFQERAYLATSGGVQARPLNFRAHEAQSRSAFQLALTTGDNNHADVTIRSFQETARLVPTAWPLLNQLAGAHVQLGQPEGAFEPLEKSLAITGENPNSRRALILRGVAYRDLGQLEEALTAFDQAVAVTGFDAQAYINRAMTLWISGRTLDAIEDLNVIIECSQTAPCQYQNDTTGFAEAYGNRGFIKQSLGQTEEALEDLDLAISYNPAYPAAYLNRGIANAEMGNFPEAIEDYSQAIRLDPNYLSAYLNRGAAQLQMGSVQKSIQDGEEAVLLDPNNSRGYVLLAMAKTAAGQDDQASDYADQAVALGYSRSSLDQLLANLRNKD